MTDQFFDAHKFGARGYTRPLQAGYLPVNLRIDQVDLDRRIKQGAAGTLWPNARVGELQMSILPNEVVLAYRTDRLPQAADGIVPAFSNLGGIGYGGMTRQQVQDSLVFAGVSGGFVIQYSNTGHGKAHVDFAAKRGGLTLLRNTGSRRIKNGDKIAWRVPNEGTLPDQGKARDGRVLAEVFAYNPRDHEASARSVRDALRAPGGVGAQARAGGGSPHLAESAKSIREFSAFTMLAALHMFAEAGIITIDEDALKKNAAGAARRRANAQVWVDKPDSKRDEIMTHVAAALGVDGVHDPTHMSKIQMPLEDGVDMGAYVSALLTCNREIVSSSHGRTGHLQALKIAQRSCLGKLLSAVTSANDDVKSRIFGTALTPAAPGEEFDALIGDPAR